MGTDQKLKAIIYATPLCDGGKTPFQHMHAYCMKDASQQHQSNVDITLSAPSQHQATPAPPPDEAHHGQVS